ncbi:MAG: hypothetical protein HUJ76_03850 [Parasporobacterium sp.]|nr:hypothetical protein [Parasporobacterium sp.]
MNFFIEATFLFYLGSITGWVIEVLFRRFISRKNPERRWINPGFCIGPWLPLYGVGLVILYFLTFVQKKWIPMTWWGILIMIVIMALCMDAIEFIGGFVILKLTNTRLWDYTDEWGNIMGLICPKFTLIWAAASAGYVFFLHPLIIDELHWLSKNLTFTFVVGLFFGFFILDVLYSSKLMHKISKFAKEQQVIVRLEDLKTNIKHNAEEANDKASFAFPLKDSKYLAEHLHEATKGVVDVISEEKNKIKTEIRTEKQKIEKDIKTKEQKIKNDISKAKEKIKK